MKIGLAQTRPYKGDISRNMDVHKQMIQLAAVYEADAIFFPELSLTGYEPELAKDLAVNMNDSRFDDFQTLSDQYNMTIGVGMPTKRNSEILISMIVFQTEQARKAYSKQYLHSDEDPYFVSGDRQVLLEVGDKLIAPAICYESLLPEHSQKAVNGGAEIYLASVAKPQSGVDKALIHYPKIAKQYAMPVLMVNCVGPSDNFQSVGTSSVWNSRGELLAQLDDSTEAILILDTDTEKVIETIV